MYLNWTKTTSTTRPVSIDADMSYKYIYFHKGIEEIDGVYHYCEAYVDKSIYADNYKDVIEEYENAEILNPDIFAYHTIAKLKEQNKELAEQNEMLTECIIEMSEIIYA